MSRSARREVGRYLRTIRHLRLAQLAHRVRLRAQQTVLRRWPDPFVKRWTHSGGVGAWPDGFQAIDSLAPPRCGTLDDLEQGRFTFLHETRALGDPVRWDPPDASQLWLYHQHYWEWTWTLLAASDRDRAQAIFARQVDSWLDATRFGRWNAWAPYPTSMRAWVFANAAGPLVRDTAVEGRFHDLLRLHAGFIEHNLELDVGGNHLIKNLKALLGLGVYFDDRRLVDLARQHLGRQLAVQVLSDGGHFELSPSYHCQVLGDLLDVEGLLAAARHPAIDGLDAAVDRMRAWLGAMLMPDGDVPLFNDCERVGLERIEALRPAARPDGAVTVLAHSGYVVARVGDRIHLVADVGQPCPPDLPAHAQADCLTFELAIDGQRVVVDPGTSEYRGGPQRQWERSTAAHSTVTVDGTDQTEVWGSFRAGRRADATLEHASGDGTEIDIRAHHTGYRHLSGSPVHHRRWRITPDEIEITDDITGTGRHSLGLRVLVDATQVLGTSEGEVKCKGCLISVEPSGADGVSVVPADHALRHGERRPALALERRWEAELPTQLIIRIHLTPP